MLYLKIKLTHDYIQIVQNNVMRSTVSVNYELKKFNTPFEPTRIMRVYKSVYKVASFLTQ